MPGRRLLQGLIPTLVLALYAAAAFAQAGAHQRPNSALGGDSGGVHDPSLARQGSMYYLFSTDLGPGGHLPIRCSADLQQWKLCGHVYQDIPAWIRQKIPGVRGLWAPDVSFFAGKYHVYYAASTFGKNHSIIALATNKTLDTSSRDYRWMDEGEVIESNRGDDWNAIDPNLAEDGKGGFWMAFGSFWSGIKMRRIDPATGKLASSDSTLYSLAARPRDASGGRPVEAPFVFRHHGFYYLFASIDYCCRGANSTYKIMVGRAHRVTGPYVDQTGKPLLEGGGTVLQQDSGEWRGPGGESLLHDGRVDRIVFHAYAAATGRPFLRLGTIEWINRWPQIAACPP